MIRHMAQSRVLVRICSTKGSFFLEVTNRLTLCMWAVLRVDIQCQQKHLLWWSWITMWRFQKVLCRWLDYEMWFRTNHNFIYILLIKNETDIWELKTLSLQFSVFNFLFYGCFYTNTHLLICNFLIKWREVLIP